MHRTHLTRTHFSEHTATKVLRALCRLFTHIMFLCESMFVVACVWEWVLLHVCACAIYRWACKKLHLCNCGCQEVWPISLARLECKNLRIFLRKTKNQKTNSQASSVYQLALHCTFFLLILKLNRGREQQQQQDDVVDDDDDDDSSNAEAC